MQATPEQSSLSSKDARHLNVAHVLLRSSLAFAFLYAGVSGFLDPVSWVGFIPPFVGRIVDPILLLTVFGIVEVLLALWLVWGKRTDIAAGISVLLLLGITLSSPGQFILLFRDLTLAGAALSLFFLDRERRPER